MLIVDFCDPAGAPRRMRFADPVELIVARDAGEVRPALRAVQRASAAGLYAVGFVSYEAAPAFDPAFVVRAGAGPPPLWFGLFRAPAEDAAPAPAGSFQLDGWRPTIDRAAHARGVDAVREAIGRGETYQVNYTLRLRSAFAGDSLALYERLRRAQAAGYCAYLDTGSHQVLSLSPELFFRWRGDRIVTRPMKGTAPRGRWPAEDRELAAWLAASEKNRAENLMIVDLLRNDLGRIARVGTVEVPSLFEVERYRTVHQLTSTVTAQVRPATTLEDVFAALFPCGSITGAPKVQTMKLIASLEDSPRGVYCGAVGLVSPGGEAVFNVAIRTLAIDRERGLAEYGVGGGITWDSTAADEYGEALLKAAVLAESWPAFELLETLRLERGAYALLDRHLARLSGSAEYFGLPLSLDAVRAELERHARLHPAQPRRVRLLVSPDGAARVESQPLPLSPEGRQTVALARTPVARHDRFLYHKTTSRDVYESRRAERPGVYDVLLWNEEGELTEFTTGNLVVELDGQRWTPPIESGLLAGTLRAELLERGEIRERVLARAELERATRVWLINSVRGWVPVVLEALDGLSADNQRFNQQCDDRR